MSYKEDAWQSIHQREDYINGLNGLLKNLQDKSFDKRKEFTKNIFTNQEEYRQKFKEMLGYPLNLPFDENDIPNIKKTFVADCEDYKLYRMQIEVLEGLWFYGMLFVKDEDTKRPFIIAQHGGGGTPEIAGSVRATGSENYNDMIKRALKYNVNVFAPQMLLWYPEDIGVKHERKVLDLALKQVGSSITAVEVYSIMKALNYFQTQKFVDCDKIGMLGMSYGGFYTLFTTACDTRIKAGLSSSFFNDRLEHNWSDWSWFNSANTFLDKEIAALVYPRYLYIVLGDHDEMFKGEKATKEFSDLKAMSPADNKDWFVGKLFDGCHEFPKQEEYLKEFMDNFLK